MARIPMLTRTITTTKATVMCLNVVQGEPYTETVTVPRTYKDDNALLKVVKSIIETDELKAVHIVAKEEIETLYGMSENTFIHYAKVLPKRGEKTEETETTEEN